MRSNTSTLLRAGAITPVALAAALCFAGTAHAAVVSVNWACQASVGTSTQTASVTTTAPASVTAGSPVAITIAPGASTVPSTASGVTINNINTMKMIIPVPANSTYVSSSASGGSVSGTTALVGSNVVLTVPGPISGGTTYTPPIVTINVTATAPGTVTSKYAGTSYSSPGMTFNTNVPLFGNIATSCYPNNTPAPASPTLTTTTVT